MNILIHDPVIISILILFTFTNSCTHKKTEFVKYENVYVSNVIYNVYGRHGNATYTFTAEYDVMAKYKRSMSYDSAPIRDIIAKHFMYMTNISIADSDNKVLAERIDLYYHQHFNSPSNMITNVAIRYVIGR